MEKYVQQQDIENFATSRRTICILEFSFEKKSIVGDYGTHAGAEDPSCE
jgi:hypothetical protein